MQDDSDMFEAAGTCFNPNFKTHHHQLLTDHHDVSNYHQIPNFLPADHQHLIFNMEMNHQQINWNQNLHDHVLLDNNFLHPQTPPDLLNLFNLPKLSSSRGISNPQPLFFGNRFNITGYGSGFGEMDMERDAVFEFEAGIVKGKGKGTKHFVTEKHRRQLLSDKFEALRILIPNPTKDDRATIVGDAIECINKLKRNLEELKILVDRKRCNKSRMKRHKAEDDSNVDVESIYTMRNSGNTSEDQKASNGNSTSTMKSKNIEIDVWIVDDEVTIKLVQQKRINCLFLVSKVFDELKLDVHHVAGGVIGDFCSYLFNNKIIEGYSVYASVIANKLIEVLDKQCAIVPVTSKY